MPSVSGSAIPPPDEPDVQREKCDCDCGCKKPAQQINNTIAGSGTTCPACNEDPIRYGSGEMELTVTDLSTGGFGQRWEHARRYRNRLSESFDFGNGFNWQIGQFSYLTLTDDGVAAIRPVGGSLWFVDTGGALVGQYGILETLVYFGGRFSLATPDGDVEEYLDFLDPDAPGKLSKYISVSGFETTIEYATDGKVAVVRRTDGVTFERYFYSYGTGIDIDHFTSVTVQRSEDEVNWSNVRRVFYTYYGAGDPNGEQGDLRTAARQMPLGIGWSDDGTCYYRYYKAGAAHGFAHGLKYVVNPAAFARLSAAAGTPFLAPDSVVSQFADNYFEYDATTQYVTKESVVGGTETTQFAYSTSAFSDGPRTWTNRCQETLPDGTTRIVYTNHIQQLLLSDHQGGTQASRWLTFQQINDDYQVEYVAESTAFDMPPSGNPYDDGEADLDVQLNASSGLVRYNDYYDGTTSQPAKYLASQWISQGIAGTRMKQADYEYGENTDSNGNKVYPLIRKTVYRDESNTPTDAIETVYTITYLSGLNLPEFRETTLPTITTAENGPNTATYQREAFDSFGNRIWSQDPRGALDYFAYDDTIGALLQEVRDYDGSDPLPPWSRGGDLPPGLNLITDYEVDPLGRTTQTLGPVHPVDGVAIRTAQWTVYKDSERQTYSAQGYAVGVGPTYPSMMLVNPVSIMKMDFDGQTTDQIQAVRSTEDGRLSPSDCFPQASWVRWNSFEITPGGRVGAQRVYDKIPACGVGTADVNYDRTAYGYDADGQQNRVVSPGGTITRTVFDPLGRTLSSWIGTDDTGATDDDPTGDGAVGNNMRKVSAASYFDNNEAATPEESRLLVDGTSGNDRVTTITLDYRNRTIDVTAPEHAFEHRVYDNLDRVVESTRKVDDNSGDPISSNYTYFDAQGHVYKAEMVGYDPSTNAATAPVTSLKWYDAAGNTLKQVAAGAKDLRAFTKISYDGAGRTTATYVGLYTGTLPEPYESVSSVADDLVFEQAEPTYDDTSNVLETISFRRYPSDVSTTGPLDDDLARPNRSASWYDGVGRNVAMAMYGTAATARPEIPPESTDAAPVTRTEYDAAGNASATIDPLGRVTRSTYDDAGRLTATIANYVASSAPLSLGAQGAGDDGNCGCGGSCSCATPADCAPSCVTPGDAENVVVRRTYDADGHLATLTAANPTTGDQTTTYFYGVTPADGSGLYSNELLREVAYPDSQSETDRVRYAYNRQGEATQMVDQNGTTHAYAFDKLGRRTADRVTTVGSGIDDSVLRLETAYNDRQQVLTVSSYDAATSGSILNQVLYVYDGFGRVLREYQSHTGAVTL